MTTAKDLITARIILRAMLPVMKVMVADNPRINRKFAGINARVQFRADHDGEPIGACMVFTDGLLEIEQGICDRPDMVFSFGSMAKMNAFFSGKPVLPKIKGILKIGLLIRIFTLLLSMKLMMPNNRPTDPDMRRLKVKLSFYMITTALSQYNKGGDPEMAAWTAKQPERIYQITVDPGDIAAYLRVKAGKSKAGRGVYARRRPFVHMKFNGVEGAFPVIMNDVDMVTAMKEGYLSVEGSPEYARDIGDFMQRIQALVT
jgi:hypothetical protein